MQKKGKPLYSLRITDRAELSLSEITDYYLAEYSVERTIKIINSLEVSFDLIRKYPFAFPICFEAKRPAENTRQAIIHGTFKIIFRVKSSTIEILEIFHSKRNPALIENL